jgi:hypothetical protein
MRYKPIVPLAVLRRITHTLPTSKATKRVMDAVTHPVAAKNANAI